MFEIVNKLIIAQDIKRLDILAPAIASKFEPGQFVHVGADEVSEKIPLSIVDADKDKGTISLIFQEVGESTRKLGSLSIGQSIFSVLGPCGVPAQLEKRGVVVCIATGTGAAQILPICRALKKAGNKTIGIIGAKTKSKLMLEAQMRIACDRIFITTNDGSYERRGLATDVLKKILEQEKINLVYAIGSVDMMQAVCSLTKVKRIRTRVHLNPIMLDCMGMCGSCRVKVGNKVVLACLDGPEFDGHQVDFNYFNVRMKSFEELEQWTSNKWNTSPGTSGSGTLTKFLSGILKS